MSTGGYPSVAKVRKELKRGSTTTIAEAMQRFWKDQAAINAGNPNAHTRLPPDIAAAAAELWEQALTHGQATAKLDDNAARERERALADAREHLLLLSKSLGRDQATLQARDQRIVDLELQIAHYRQQIEGLIADTIERRRVSPRRAPAQSVAPRLRRRQVSVLKRVKPAPAQRKAVRPPKPAQRRRSPKPSPRHE